MKMVCNDKGICVLCQTDTTGFVAHFNIDGQFQTLQWVPAQAGLITVVRDLAFSNVSNDGITVTICGHGIDGLHHSTPFVSTLQFHNSKPAGGSSGTSGGSANAPSVTSSAAKPDALVRTTPSQDIPSRLDEALQASENVNSKLVLADNALVAQHSKIQDHGLRILFPHRYPSKTTATGKLPWKAVVALSDDGLWQLEHTVVNGKHVTNTLVRQSQKVQVPAAGLTESKGLGKAGTVSVLENKDSKDGKDDKNMIAPETIDLPTPDPFYPMRMITLPDGWIIVGYTLRDSTTKDSAELCCLRVSSDRSVGVRTFTVPGFLYHQTLTGATYDVNEKVLYLVGYAQTNKTRFSRKGCLFLLYL